MHAVTQPGLSILPTNGVTERVQQKKKTSRLAVFPFGKGRSSVGEKGRKRRRKICHQIHTSSGVEGSGKRSNFFDAVTGAGFNIRTHKHSLLLAQRASARTQFDDDRQKDPSKDAPVRKEQTESKEKVKRRLIIFQISTPLRNGAEREGENGNVMPWRRDFLQATSTETLRLHHRFPDRDHRGKGTNGKPKPRCTPSDTHRLNQSGVRVFVFY